MSTAKDPRPEMNGAILNLGGNPIPLKTYKGTGLIATITGSPGCGKSNMALVIAEQLAEQGWLSIIFDPEPNTENHHPYGATIESESQLVSIMTKRTTNICVIKVDDIEKFNLFAIVIDEQANKKRQPVIVIIDEGQLFCSPKQGSSAARESRRLIENFVNRGRKRSIDICITGTSHTNSLSETVMQQRNLAIFGSANGNTGKFIINQNLEDSGFTYHDVMALQPGQFICRTRTETDKIKAPIAKSLAGTLAPSPTTSHSQPKTYNEWLEMVEAIDNTNLAALTPDVVNLLSEIAGLKPAQVNAGLKAIVTEKQNRNL